MTVKSSNIFTVEHRVDQSARWFRNGHRGGILWLTGLSGSGKSTLAVELERRLFNMSYQAYGLDGDNVRHGLCRDLGFAPEDRVENIRRIGEVAALFADAGYIVMTAFISPYEADRLRARETSDHPFHEVYLSASVEVCESRDPKGLYRKARAGEIPEFTGVSAPYEAPAKPELTIDTGKLSIEESLQMLLSYVNENFLLSEYDVARRVA